LPPPPSQLSENGLRRVDPYLLDDQNLHREQGEQGDDDEEEEEEEEDEAPPDFTTRIPLLSSQLRSPQMAHPHRSKRTPRVVHPMSPSPSTTSSSRSRGSTTRQQKPRNNGILGHDASPSSSKPRRIVSMSARERALWRWVNVDDLDRFLEEVYRYYLGKGVWTIGLERILNLL